MKLPPIILLLCPLILAACGKAPQPTSPHILAEVNGEPITVEEYRAAWQRNPTNDSPETRSALLDALIERRLLAQRAREEGLHDDPVVRLQIEALLAARYREKHLLPSMAETAPSEEALRAAYERLPASDRQQPERLRLALLWLDDRGDPARRERYYGRLKEARLKALQDSDLQNDPAAGFGTLAISYSDHQPTRFKGGVKSWIENVPALSDWEKAAVEAAANLQEHGAISEVATTSEGLFVVRLIERIPASEKPFETLRTPLKRRIQQKTRQEIQRNFDENVRTSQQIIQYPDHLQKLKLDPE